MNEKNLNYVKRSSGRYPWGFKVLRTQELVPDSILVGDQIMMKLEGFGEFTATAQQITDNGAIFLFDDCVAKRPMNNDWANKGGFEASDLNKWLQNVLLPTFPEELRSRISNLTLPTCGQMFDGDELEWCREKLEDDGNEQWKLMKNRHNRIADFGDNDYTWYWLQNATKKEVSAASFALVDADGDAFYYDASNSGGVRPAFLLVD